MITANNYLLQAQSARQLFLTYDQEALIRKLGLRHDECYLYLSSLGTPYRLCRKTGMLEKQIGDRWQDGSSFGETLTLLDLICDSRESRWLTGSWKPMQEFGLMFHRNLLEDQRDPLALAIDAAPEGLHRAARAMGAEPIPGGDLGYAFPLFQELAIGLRFWHSDEEFAPRLRFYWDENALRYIRYETMHFAVGLLKERIQTYL